MTCIFPRKGKEMEEVAVRIEITLDVSSTKGNVLDYSALLKTALGPSLEPAPVQSSGQETEESETPDSPTTDVKTKKKTRKNNHEECEYDYEDAFIDDRYF
jgi:hypothetical protein